MLAGSCHDLAGKVSEKTKISSVWSVLHNSIVPHDEAPFPSKRSSKQNSEPFCVMPDLDFDVITLKRHELFCDVINTGNDY